MSLPAQDMQIEEFEREGYVEWINSVDDEDRQILGVRVIQEDDSEYFIIFISVAEFIREEPLENEFREKIHLSLSKVPGVKAVEEEDREVWAVEGSTNGPALIKASVATLQELKPKFISYLNEL